MPVLLVIVSGCSGCWFSLDPVKGNPGSDGGGGNDGALDATVDASTDAAQPSDAAADAEVLCGNGSIDLGETCDGTDLAGQSCKTLGHLGGTLSCAQCQLDESGCWDTCGSSTGHFCPASQATDDFEDQVCGALWGGAWVTGGASYQETGSGMLRFDLPVSSVGYAGYMTSDLFDFREDAITLEVLSVPNPSLAAAELSFEVVDDVSGDYMGITVSGGQLTGFYNQGNPVQISAVTYSGSAHRFWRLRESGGIFFWGTSADGLTWQERGSTPNVFPMEAVRVAIQAGCFLAVLDPGTALVDNFNLLP